MTAGSRLTIYGGEFFSCRYEFTRCTNVVFPLPAIPIVIITIGGSFGPLELAAALPLGAALGVEVDAILVLKQIRL